MVSISTGAAPQDVRQGARHTLFVESASKDGLDVTVLAKLLPPKVRVEPLGASFSVRSVATALHEYHPEYWFLIDRDDWDDDAVEATWRGFPDPSQANLLIWRRKELENYLLEPDWVGRSRYLRPDTTPADLQRWLACEADKALWLTAANRVLIVKRNRLKQRTGELFKPGDLRNCSREEVVGRLLTSPLLAGLAVSAGDELAEDRLRADFDAEVTRLSGGVLPLAWGVGRWRDLMPGKAMYRAMVNRWFDVPNQSKGGRARLTGREAERALVEELLVNYSEAMPNDLATLRTMLERQT